MDWHLPWQIGSRRDLQPPGRSASSPVLRILVSAMADLAGAPCLPVRARSGAARGFDTFRKSTSPTPIILLRIAFRIIRPPDSCSWARPAGGSNCRHCCAPAMAHYGRRPGLAATRPVQYSKQPPRSQGLRNPWEPVPNRSGPVSNRPKFKI